MIPIVVSTGQSNNPLKRELEEAVINGLDQLPGCRVLVIPHLYDLAARGESIATLRETEGDIVILSWLYPRSAHWILDRQGIHGNPGEVQLDTAEDDEEENAHRLRSAPMQGGRASLWRLVPPTDMKAEEVDEATPKMLTRISKWQKG